MSNPFIGEIRMFGGNFAPAGWAFCEGALQPISENDALFTLIGTTYGGNGQTTFALPDLRGRAPMHVGGGFLLGQAVGQEFHTLTQSEMPAHTHVLNGTSNDGTQLIPVGNLLARGATQLYAPPANLAAMNAASVTNVGGSQPHENRQPYLVLNVIIALQGIFPSRN